jgi:drug/metabolite transporter (DMT)-like permease
MGVFGYLALLTLGITLGSVFFLTASALGEMGPLLLMTVRAVLGFSFLSFLGLFLRPPVLSLLRRRFWPLLAVALANYAISWPLIAWGQTRTESSTAGVLAASSPIFTALIARFLLPGEALRLRVLLGLLVGLAGVALIAGFDFDKLGASTLTGDLAVVGGAVLFALAAVIFRRYLAGANELGLAISMGLLCVLVLVPAAALTYSPSDLEVSSRAWGALLILGLVTGLGLTFPSYLWLVRRAGPVRASLVFYISPAVAVLLGWGVRGEKLDAHTIVGLLLIVTSLTLVNQAARLPLRPRSPAPLRT